MGLEDKNEVCRKKIDKEVACDLEKEYERILAEAHEELLCHPERGYEENIIHAQKRVASVQVRSIIRMETLMKQAIWIAIGSFIISLATLLWTLIGNSCH